MHSSEPARKKLKLAGEAEKCQEPSKIQAVLDTRDPSNATDTCKTSQGPHSSDENAAATASDTQKFTVFVIDTGLRLFVAGFNAAMTAYFADNSANTGVDGAVQRPQSHSSSGALWRGLQIITHGLKTVQKQVSEINSCSIKPDGHASGLELTAAWSTMVGVFMALQHHHLTHEGVTDLLHMLQSFLNMLKMLTETCQAVERFAATCIRQGIPNNSTINDPYTGEPVQDPNTNPYTAAIPLVLRQHLTALLPGIHALSHVQFDSSAIQPREYHDLKEWLPNFLTMPVAKAVLKVADLEPCGVLHRAVTFGSNELQQHLPDSLRKQYLHELFPDLSLEANFIEEPERYELVVLRDDVFHASSGADISSQPYAMQEWLTLFTKDVFGKAGGVFQPCPGDPATVHPIRAQERGEKDWPYWPEGLVRAGKLAGLAICYRCPIGIRLSRACLKMMTGRPVSLEDFQEVDPQLYCTMSAIKSASEEELQAMALTFESPDGDAFALQGSDEPVGQPVTLANRKKYLDCLFHYFFDCSEQVGHFLEGLCSTSEWYNFNEHNEKNTSLEMMLRPMLVDDFGRHLAGTLAPLDVDDWRRATVTTGFYHPAQQELDWFWQMVTDMDDDQRRQLLCFWTSMSTVPAGGFQELSSKLKLQTSSQGLPTSHTCFFQLNMPWYSSVQEMTAAFTRAMQESKGFGFG
ncbi:MAG: E3 ubiquitin- ligase UPL5 [Trebouxia sp. A1-2]|nr:MAG: E3 ubiquitin- ligase UPL5 [Trebouxia sp. A1-2]